MASTSRNTDFINNSDDSDPDYVADVAESDETSAEEQSSGESDVENTEYSPVWSPTTQGLRQFPFTKEKMLKVPIPGNNKPIDWFYLLLDEVLLENIVRETNRYAREVFFSPNLMPKSRINNWRKDLTVEELKIFLGILFHMGTVRLNRINDYWKTSRFFNFGVVREEMSRDRFLLILRCIHFAKNDKENNDRLYKVRLLIDHFNNKMDYVYYPCKELSLDEGMVLCRGRLIFRQYAKGNRHKYGIKIYALCEPHGLVVRFAIYTGSEGELSGKGLALKVVLHLMKGNLNCGHSLYMDNYYNSFPLAAQLLAKKTYCTGTLRLDRKYLPEEVKSTKLKKGESIARYAEGVMVAKWKDRRVVSYISTEHENTMAMSSNKRQVQREKPLPIVQYDANMKGVDRNDQLMSYYPVEHKSLRWYKKVFVHFLQMTMVNAYKLYSFCNPQSRMSLYDFRLQVIAELIPEPGQPAPIRPPRNPKHVLSKIRKRDAKGKLVRVRCRVGSHALSPLTRVTAPPPPPHQHYFSQERHRLCYYSKLNWGKISAALAVSLGPFAAGLGKGYSSPAIASIQEKQQYALHTGNYSGAFLVSPQQASWVASLSLLGALFGAIFGGIAMRFGRKRVLVFTSIPFSASWFVTVFANSVEVMFATGFVGGFCCAIVLLVSQVYISEIAGPDIRGCLSAVLKVFGHIGVLISFAIGAYLDWRQLAFVIAGAPLMLLMSILYIPETPSYLVLSGREQEAAQALRWLRGPHADIQPELATLRDNVLASRAFRPTDRQSISVVLHPILITCGLMLFQRFSGANAFNFYAVSIFRQTFGGMDPHGGAVAVAFVQLLASLLSGLLIDTVGRLPLLIASSVFMSIALAAFGSFAYYEHLHRDRVAAQYDWIPLLCVLVFTIAFSMGISPISWLLIGELFPLEYRGLGSALATSFSYACAFIGVKTFVDFQQLLGLHGAFWLYAAISVCGLCFVVCFVPETKGRGLDEMDHKYVRA